MPLARCAGGRDERRRELGTPSRSRRVRPLSGAASTADAFAAPERSLDGSAVRSGVASGLLGSSRAGLGASCSSSAVGGLGIRLARFCSSNWAAASNLDAPPSGEDGGGGVWTASLDASPDGAIPSNVLRRVPPPSGGFAGTDDTRTAGGREVVFGSEPGLERSGVGKRWDAGLGGASDASFGVSDTGFRSDSGFGASDAGLERSEDFGLSPEAQASSISSVGTGNDEAAPLGSLGDPSVGRGRHEGSRGWFLSTGSPLIASTFTAGRRHRALSGTNPAS
jgi:hypothetical protein